MFTEDDLIHVYTRRQAIEDGVLEDVTEIARLAGIRIPTAITRIARRELTFDIHEDPNHVETDERVSYCLREFVRVVRSGFQRSRRDENILVFVLAWRRSDTKERTTLIMKAVCGPDDDGKPCLTVMLAEED